MVKNISDKEIELITYKLNDYYEKEIVKLPLKPGESTEYEITVTDYCAWDKPLRNSQLLNFGVTFMMDNQYYGVANQRVYKARYFPHEFDLSFDVTMYDGEYKSLDNAYAFYKIDITNKGQDIPEFKYFFEDQKREIYAEEEMLYIDDFYNYGVLKKGEKLSVYTRLKANTDIFGYFARGNVLANILEFYELNDESFEKNRYSRDGYFKLISKQDKGQDQRETNEELKETTAEVEEKKEPENETEKSAQTPTQKMEARHVETKSSMPSWVGIVLGAALIGTIVIIIVLRKKQD